MGLDFEIVVDEELYTYSENKHIVALCYLKFMDGYFPNDRWTDLVNSVLGMWTYDLTKHSNCDTKKFILYFMDGPYRLDVAKDENMKATIQCVNYRYEDVVEMSFVCYFIDLLKAVYEANKKMSKMLFDKKMHKGKYASVYKDYLLNCEDLMVAIESLNAF